MFILCRAAKNEPRKQISASRNRKFACSRSRTSRKRGRKHCAPRGLIPLGFPQRTNVATLSLRSCLREVLHFQLLRLQVKETCKHEDARKRSSKSFCQLLRTPSSTNLLTKTIFFCACRQNGLSRRQPLPRKKKLFLPPPAARGGKMASKALKNSPRFGASLNTFSCAHFEARHKMK